MRIIIAPAKKMNADTDSLEWRDLPQFLSRTEAILLALRRMDYGQLKKLWKCNDSIARLNFDRIQQMDLRRGLTPAIIGYEGIQYQYMAPGVFSSREFDYVQKHLRILSGFYGVLRPFDGVTPYRLEMQAKLALDGAKDLYEYWGSSLADSIFSECSCVLNLASKEYSMCISKYMPEGKRIIDCVFGEETGGRVIEKGTMCKMARGEMVRYMAENRIEDIACIRNFDRLDYRYSPEYSNENTLVFLRKPDTKNRPDR